MTSSAPTPPLPRSYAAVPAAIGIVNLAAAWPKHTVALAIVEALLGAIACLALTVQRRHPVGVALMTIAAAAFSPLAVVAALLAMAIAARDSSVAALVLLVAGVAAVVAGHVALAGADDFLLKDTPPAEIVRAIELVAAGEGILSPPVARQLIAHIAGDGGGETRPAAARQRLGALTDREREVARAVGQGKTNADIAGELYMSVATVKAHVTHLLAKLELDNRVQIALLVQDAAP